MVTTEFFVDKYEYYISCEQLTQLNQSIHDLKELVFLSA